MPFVRAYHNEDHEACLHIVSLASQLFESALCTTSGTYLMYDAAVPGDGGTRLTSSPRPRCLTFWVFLVVQTVHRLDPRMVLGT